MTKKNNTYPLDIFLCLLTSLLLLPLVFLNIDSTFRLILGLPFLLFIPGYVLVFALFPARKTDRGIDALERIVLSFGLSIAVVPLIGLLLNYTPWGIRLEPIMSSLLLFIISIGLFGIYRWRKTDPEERFTLPQKITFPKQENPIDRALSIILIIAIIVVIASLIYVITLPKTGETFTEFYLLGPTGTAEGYPRNLTINEEAAVIIGVANHEQRLINYTIEIWLINQTTTNNQTIYHQMWYLDTITINTLPYQPINTEEPWTPQWSHPYTFHLNRTGTFKLAFLLFKGPTQTYYPNIDYHDIADQKITTAYLETHLWLTIQ
jgi:uncharacterized membrane protein